MLPGLGADELVAVGASSLGRIDDGQFMQFFQHSEGLVVDLPRSLYGLLTHPRLATNGVGEVWRERFLHEGLDGLGSCSLLAVHAVRVTLVAAFAVLPGHGGVVLELIEPGADQGVAALHLVVEEGEGQGAVHRLDPQREAAKFDGQGIEVNTVETALDHVAAQHRLEPRLEEFIVGATGQELFAEPLLCSSLRARPGQEGYHRAVALFVDAPVVMERGVESVGQKA